MMGLVLYYPTQHLQLQTRCKILLLPKTNLAKIWSPPPPQVQIQISNPEGVTCSR